MNIFTEPLNSFFFAKFINPFPQIYTPKIHFMIACMCLSVFMAVSLWISQHLEWRKTQSIMWTINEFQQPSYWCTKFEKSSISQKCKQFFNIVLCTLLLASILTMSDVLYSLPNHLINNWFNFQSNRLLKQTSYKRFILSDLIKIYIWLA